METFLRMKAVKAATGLGRSSIYQLIKEGKFPRPCKIGLQAVAWPSSEIERWQRARVAERDESDR